MTTRADQQGCDRDRLWALAVGAATEEEAQLQEDHLAGCPRCRDQLATIRGDVEALGCHATAGTSADELTRGVLERARAVELRARRLRWLAVGALLVAGLVGGLATAHQLASNARARRELWRLEHAIHRLQDETGRYPADERELARTLARVGPPELRLAPDGRPLDPWGRPFRYRYPGLHVRGLFDLWSAGADGVDEEGQPDDVTNWR